MAYINDKLGRGEQIIYIGHQHVMLILVRAVKWIGLFVASFILAFWIGLQWKANANDWTSGAKTIIILGLSIAALASFIAVFYAYLVWLNEEFIISNERVIKVEGIVNKTLADSSLDKVNDVEMYQSLFGRILGYGSISIITGNETGTTTFLYLGNPNEFKRAMLDAKNGFYGDASDVAREQALVRQQVPATQNSAPVPQQAYNHPVYQETPNSGVKQADIPALISQLAKLRDQGAITEQEFQNKKNDLLRRM